MPLIRRAALLLMMCLPLTASALSIGGVEIPERVTAAGGGPPLQLNGAGVRSRFFLAIYVGALYLAERESSADELLATLPANRMLMHFVHRQVDRQKMAATWREGFERSRGADGTAALDDRLQRFIALFGDMRRGDQVWLDYEPGRGTTVSINGEPRDTIPGPDFNRALLGIWLGAKPVSAALKNALVGVDNN